MTTNTLAAQIEATADYQEKANVFLANTNATFTAEFLRHGKHFDDDKETRDIYKCTISRAGRKIEIVFGQSVINSEHWTVKDIYETINGGMTTKARSSVIFGNLYRFKSANEARDADNRYNGSYTGRNVKHKPRQTPTAYDVITCLTKYHPGTFEDFCSEFGYDTDSKKAEKTYYAVLKEYADVSSMFSADVLEAMQEIN